MRRKNIFILALISLFLFSSIALSAEYWASKNSNKYHYPTCKWAQKINPNNLVKFNSPEEAIKAGNIPCKVCKPPVTSRSEVTDEQITIAKVKGLNDPQRRGCCSWHGGVCGCENGRAVCCDNTLSPSCGCD
ncbi:MAG: Ada metal-binding domain-containing protein [Syntrophales bacterium]